MRNSAEQEPDGPAGWTIESFHEHWDAHLAGLKGTPGIEMPLERIRVQAQQTPAYREAVIRWSSMSPGERVQAWEALLESVPDSLREVLPVCVRCGECCREGSPSLYVEDIELLRAERIPWDMLVTLRHGEPARSPATGAAFYLPEERIKLREKSGSGECVFLDAADSGCTIYPDRPLQCRVQACWDAEAAVPLSSEPLLTRRRIFAGIEPLLELLDEHDRRCSFGRLRQAFEELRQTQGKSVEKVIEILALDEHFREFVCERMNIPADVTDLVFGRPLADRVRLFGFRVDTEEDGTRVLVPDRR